MLSQFSHLKFSLQSGLLCGAICLGAMALQAPFGSPVFGQDALDVLNQPAATAPVDPQAARNAELKKQASELFFTELEKLVPGEQAEGSPAAEALRTAAEAYVERKSDMAMSIFDRTATSNANFPPAELMMAALHLAAKNQNGGLQALQEAAIKNPNHPAIYAAYGRLAVGTNRSVDAKVHFEKLLALLDQGKLDKAAVAHYENVYLDGMSQTALKLKDYEQARNLGGELLKRDAENTSALHLLARIDFEEKKYDDVVANLAKLREKNPDARAPEAIVGTWFSRAGDKANANAWFGKLPAKYPNDATAQLEYASWALSQENIEGASAAIRTAEATGKATVVSNVFKGKIAFYQQKYDESVGIFKALHEEAKGKNPDIANMYVLSLIESSNAENRILANQLARVNMKANQNNRVVLATLGYVQLRTLGVTDDLKRVFVKIAQTRDGRSPEVDYFLANFLKQVGDAKKAVALLDQASKHDGLFLYRRKALQMKQGLAAGVLPTP